jgi:hypothetical protein
MTNYIMHRLSLPRAALFSFVMLVLFTEASPTFAQGTSEQRAACLADAFRLCGAFIPDVNSVTSCMVRQHRNLSQECASTMSKRGPRHEDRL